jgi:hypothetical protein
MKHYKNNFYRIFRAQHEIGMAYQDQIRLNAAKTHSKSVMKRSFCDIRGDITLEFNGSM